jgi:hypothetical protein
MALSRVLTTIKDKNAAKTASVSLHYVCIVLRYAALRAADTRTCDT